MLGVSDAVHGSAPPSCSGHFTTRAGVDSSPAIGGGRVYGLDLASGKKVWEYEARAVSDGDLEAVECQFHWEIRVTQGVISPYRYQAHQSSDFAHLKSNRSRWGRSIWLRSITLRIETRTASPRTVDDPPTGPGIGECRLPQLDAGEHHAASRRRARSLPQRGSPNGRQLPVAAH
jgi:hypothetical protein